MEPLLRPVVKAHGMGTARLLTQWESVVGPRLAGRTLPEKLSFPKGKKTGGTLTIAAENGFATELQHMQPLILERLATYFGYQAITRIAISHTYIPAAATPPTPPVKKVLPDCTALADTVDDPELKAALQSLAKTLAGS